jgi:hypothetical protein
MMHPFTDSSPNEELIDPDPLSVLLIALGAAGSVASLAAYMGERMSASRSVREANRFALRDAIMGVETALNELRGYVRSLEITFVTGARRTPLSSPGMSLAFFGRVSLVFTREGYERWHEIEEGVLTAAGRVQRHMNSLLRIFATSELRIPPDTAARLTTAVEDLNGIVSRLGQTHFEDLFGSLEATITECMDAMRMLRDDTSDLRH